MDYILFLIASSIEYFGTFIFMLALFRFRLLPRMLVNVLLVSFLMSQVSYFTRLYDLGDFTTYVQFVLFVVVLWVTFRVPLFHSFVMNFAGLAINVITVGGTILLAGALTGMPTEDMLANIWVASSLQVLSAVIAIGISRTIYVFHLGFDFVPTSRRTTVHIRGTNAVLLVIISFAIIVSALTTYLFRNNFESYLIYCIAVYLLTIPFFFYFSVRKDHEDAA